ncbi:hypothetical protein [Actinacidiphila bryophytorum]|uniref:hypothetical protein n=1 Tax=Actinacidiphila bryophytorum TaxID=1436133 RepID=UPI00196041D3|nr:hypothetical protein [Actinacidiphila bryophytorum]MBM9438189.1 hypothetical protein [Actinacidiphila bryophytorum]MBN6544673.1 hypothetical protein [Actinacidiphila bryophytorum]
MTSQPAASLRSRYVEQAASDLQDNRRRQQELAESIRVLKQEEALLLDILTLAERYGSDPGPAADAPVQAETATVPAPREPEAAAAPEEHRHRAKAPQALLGDLLAGLLEGHDEPRHAKELREELMDEHPDRSPTPQVVRNTLESLVAKGRIRRHKQRRSVLYSLV